jgi:hypothetical protein
VREHTHSFANVCDDVSCAVRLVEFGVLSPKPIKKMVKLFIKRCVQVR